MLDATTIILAALAAGTVYYWLHGKRKPSRVQGPDGAPLMDPPCLPTVPFLGSLPYLPPFPLTYRFFAQHSDKYCHVVAYYVLNKYRIVLNSRQAIQEAFVKRSTDFADRPTGPVNNILNPNHKGILFHSYNEDFKKYHRLSLGIMKQFGFGNRIMEKRIMEEVESLLETLAKFKGANFNPSPIITKCSMNVICGLLFGKRFEDDDPNLEGIITNLRASFRNLAKIFVINIFPFLRHIPYFKRALDSSIEAQEKVIKMLEEKILECTGDSYDRLSFIRSYVETEGPRYDRLQLLHFMHELFLAGTETTASTLEWTLVLLGNNREVQDKMVSEMSRLGERLPSLDDKKDLPYCDATFCEILRMKPVAPMSLPHMTMSDTNVMGYFIPDKTMVVANLYAAHHNVEIWKDPENFRPERFLKDGLLDTSVKDLLVPFSLGKRSCFGEILAKQEVFLALTNLIKRFVILPPSGHVDIKVDDLMDVTSKPSSFEVRLVERS